jgi:prepilin-type processing-associated H-X9-DG protein
MVKVRRPWLRVSNSYVSRHDGTSRTLLLTENADATGWRTPMEDANCVVWQAENGLHINQQRGTRPGGKNPHYRVTGNLVLEGQSDIRFARPSSFHRGNGVNAVFCDGHGRFLSETIEYWVYVQLMTRHGRGSMANVEQSLPAPVEFMKRRDP